MLTGTFTEAARMLQRSQPVVSARIAGLDGQLGMKLFERRRGSRHQVPELPYLNRECAVVLERFANLRQDVLNLKSLGAGEFRIVLMSDPSMVLLSNRIAEFVAVHLTYISLSPDSSTTALWKTAR